MEPLLLEIPTTTETKTMSNQMDKVQAALVKGVQTYADQVRDSLVEVGKLMEARQYEKANLLMARITQAQARTAQSMRSALIKHGKVQDDFS